MTRELFASLLFACAACAEPDFEETNTSSSSSAMDGSSSTSSSTTSTVTTSTVTTDASTSDDTSGDDTTTGTTTSEDPPCNMDGVCDDDEDFHGCLVDCATCEPDGVCDDTFETPGSCPEDCPAESCNDDGVVDPLTEQCDDGNGDSSDECTSSCNFNVCGDGIIHVGVEECDDGNLKDEDGCNSLCVQETLTVFLSSQKYKGGAFPPLGGIKNGVALADAHCNLLAAEAGLSGTYMAWISDPTSDPEERFGSLFTESLAAIILPDGSVVAEGGFKGLQTTLLNSISMTENGDTILGSEAVYTNTTPVGTTASDKHHCNQWSNVDQKSLMGRSDALQGEWSLNPEEIPCYVDGRVYCFQVSYE